MTGVDDGLMCCDMTRRMRVVGSDRGFDPEITRRAVPGQLAEYKCIAAYAARQRLDDRVGNRKRRESRRVVMAKRLVGGLSGIVDRQCPGHAAGPDCQIAGVDCDIRKPQKLQIREMVAAVTSGGSVMHHDPAIDVRNVIVADIAGEDGRVDPLPAIDDIVANAAGDEIVARTAIDHIIVRRCAKEPVLMIGGIDMNVADVKIERAR